MNSRLDRGAEAPRDVRLENARSRHEIDAAIDDAARRLTAIDPQGYMASRVVARLGARRQRNWRTPLLVAVASAAVMTFAVVFTNRPVAPPRQAPTGASTSSTPVTPSGDRVPSPIRAVAVTRHHLGLRSDVKIDLGGQPEALESAAETAWRSRAVPALPEPAPIEGQVSQPEPIDLPLLQLKPLETPPIQLARLDGGRS
jgi:hypothetical protein